jgi:hypothetical protein
VLVIGLLVAGCGGSSKSKPSTEDAKPFADSFMHRLVEVGTWNAVEGDVSPDVTREVQSFQVQLRRDGIDRVAKKGVLRHDCPPAPSVGAGKDCFVYVVSGRQVVPLGGVQKLKARLRLWVEPLGDGWEVNNYDYQLIPAS